MSVETLKRRNAETPSWGSVVCVLPPGGLVRTCGLLGWIVAAAPLFGQEPETKPPSQPRADKLGERLIREAASGGDEDPMEHMLSLMDEAATKLEIEFDAGSETQAVQARIVDQLDKAIRMAAAQRRSARSRSSQFTGEKRKRSEGQPRTGDQAAEANAGADSAADAAATSSRSSAAAAEARRGELREVRRTWGLLPQREREEIMQGSEESFLERYRDWIQRYYQALQEAPR